MEQLVVLHSVTKLKRFGGESQEKNLIHPLRPGTGQATDTYGGLAASPKGEGKIGMFFTVAGHIVTVIHFLWIAFIIAGFPLFFYLNLATWRVLHLVALTVTVLMQAGNIICPLTYLEAYLKSQDSSDCVYRGSFIVACIEDMIYVDDVNLIIIGYLTAAYLLAVVISFFVRPVRK